MELDKPRKKRGPKPSPRKWQRSDLWFRIGYVVAYRGNPECVLAFERLELQYMCWAEIEPKVVYVMFRVRQPTRGRDVFQCISNWNEMHTEDDQIVPFLLPGMSNCIEAQHGHQITARLVKLQREISSNFQMKSYGTENTLAHFENTPKAPTPLDRATKIDRENVVLRDQIEYLKNRLEMYEPQEETRRHVPNMPLKASSILVLKSREMPLPPGPDGVSPGTVKITRVTAPAPSDKDLVRPGPTLLRTGATGIQMDGSSDKMVAGSTMVFGIPMLQADQSEQTWTPPPQRPWVHCDPSPRVSEEAREMAELGLRKDYFHEVPKRPGAIGAIKGNPPRVPWVNAYCWGDKVLDAQLQAGQPFSLDV